MRFLGCGRGLLPSLGQTLRREKKIPGQREHGDGEFVWDTLNLRCPGSFGGGAGQAAGDGEARSGAKTQMRLICREPWPGPRERQEWREKRAKEDAGRTHV